MPSRWQHGRDLRDAAVLPHRVMAVCSRSTDTRREPWRDLRLSHGVAAIFDDDGVLVITDDNAAAPSTGMGPGRGQ